ncbi:hypothetical protein [Paenibacillus qinlingensis]|nr:hypothetical protein [Paenibacillus qinlingensis]
MIRDMIAQERKRQDKLHPNFPKELRLAILVEEVGEISTALQNGDIENLKTELTQTAATAIRWLEHIKKEEST